MSKSRRLGKIGRVCRAVSVDPRKLYVETHVVVTLHDPPRRPSRTAFPHPVHPFPALPIVHIVSLVQTFQSHYISMCLLLRCYLPFFLFFLWRPNGRRVRFTEHKADIHEMAVRWINVVKWMMLSDDLPPPTRGRTAGGKDVEHHECWRSDFVRFRQVSGNIFAVIGG